MCMHAHQAQTRSATLLWFRAPVPSAMPIRWKWNLATWCHGIAILSEWHDTKLSAEAKRSEAAARFGLHENQIWVIRHAVYFEAPQDMNYVLLGVRYPVPSEHA